MKILVVLAAIIAIASAMACDLLRQEWDLYKIEHSKSYDTEIEDEFRFKIYKRNRRLMMEHNKLYAEGKKTFKMGVNKFTDRFDEEKRAFLPAMQIKANKTGIIYIPPANVEIPDRVDWREKGAVTPVKDQGPCGSCWAFSATGSLEGQYFRKTGKLVSLSEQNLIDCTNNGMYRNSGCNGGMINNAFEYIIDNHGIDTEESYPYRAMDGDCKFDKDHIGATEAAYADIISYDRPSLKAAVGVVGPISIAIEATTDLMSYESGVFRGEDCTGIVINHAVLLVGYGHDKESNLDYWLIKNSWGEDWGDAGYFKMIRPDRKCSTSVLASFPLV